MHWPGNLKLGNQNHYIREGQDYDFFNSGCAKSHIKREPVGCSTKNANEPLMNRQDVQKYVQPFLREISSKEIRKKI